jgi:hypothetical protein
MGLTVKAGSAAGALASSRWFVPLLGASAGADVVQLVAFTDLTLAELDKIDQGAGTPEDRQRAAAVLVTQWLVTGGLTVLSVQGARNARALAGQPIEIIEQNGVKVARVAGESAPEPAVGSKPAAADTQHPSTGAVSKPMNDGGQGSMHSGHQAPVTGPHADASPQAPVSQRPEHTQAGQPSGPPKLTRPSAEPDPRSSPTGKRAVPAPAEQDQANIRALEQENESADILSKHGYQVEQNPKVPGRKNPDFRIEGAVFDNYAPTTSSPRSIWTTVQQKVVSEQTRRIVLNLSEGGADLNKLKAQFDQWPIEDLEQIIVVKGSTVIRFWP